MPGGSKGVLSKSNFPWVAEYAENIGLFWDEHIILRFILACGLSLPYS